MIRTIIRYLASYVMEKPKVIFVLGAPGSGKGTQCAKIVENFGYLHLSAGDLLRKERSNPDSKYGQMISQYIRDGKIVPVKVTCTLIEDAIKASGSKKVMVDGFPRNKDNLDGWNEQMGGKADVDFVLFLKCGRETCTERILKRAETSGRTDDNLESLRKRFDTYVNQTMPIIEHFEKVGKVRTIDAEHNPEEVFDKITKLFD